MVGKRDSEATCPVAAASRASRTVREAKKHAEPTANTDILGMGEVGKRRREEYKIDPLLEYFLPV